MFLLLHKQKENYPNYSFRAKMKLELLEYLLSLVIHIIKCLIQKKSYYVSF